MSPLEVSILIHYHCFPGDFRDGDFSAPAVREAIDYFVAQGMLRTPTHRRTYYEATDGCSMYVKQICSVPLPSLKWSY